MCFFSFVPFPRRLVLPRGGPAFPCAIYPSSSSYVHSCSPAGALISLVQCIQRSFTFCRQANIAEPCLDHGHNTIGPGLRTLPRRDVHNQTLNPLAFEKNGHNLVLP